VDKYDAVINAIDQVSYVTNTPEMFTKENIKEAMTNLEDSLKLAIPKWEELSKEIK
jgi:hypothetical protein